MTPNMWEQRGELGFSYIEDDMDFDVMLPTAVREWLGLVGNEGEFHSSVYRASSLSGMNDDGKNFCRRLPTSSRTMKRCLFIVPE